MIHNMQWKLWQNKLMDSSSRNIADYKFIRIFMAI